MTAIATSSRASAALPPAFARLAASLAELPEECRRDARLVQAYERRRVALAALCAADINYGRGTESYLYTSLEALLAQSYDLCPKSASLEPDAAALDAARIPGSIELVFVNGLFRPTLSRGLSEHAQGLRFIEGLPPASHHDSDPFLLLNEAFHSCEMALELTASDLPPIHILQTVHASSGEIRTLALPRVHFSLAAGVQASVIQSCIGLAPGRSYLHCPATDLVLAEDARLSFLRLQAEDDAAFHVGSVRASLATGASLEATALSAGAALARLNFCANLQGARAEARLYSLAATAGSQLADLHSCLNHQAADTSSRQLAKGMLDGRSRQVFNGRIAIDRDAQRVDSSQMSRSLLLSPQARMDAKPELDVRADDVKAAHGAAIGQLNEDQLFYLLSRCISRQEATAMLLEGFMEEIAITVPETLRPLLRRLSHRIVNPGA